MSEYLKIIRFNWKENYARYSFSFRCEKHKIKYDDISYCLNSSSLRCIDCEGGSRNYELARFRPKHGLRIPIRLIVCGYQFETYSNQVIGASALQIRPGNLSIIHEDNGP